jgi:NADPH-dependent 2,4-dienoyl-CoA reductase/sulfur reductase-like enzyme/peroxiredoxin family protein/rhodanese-related sulfurtransferase/TusA-related sulfurtransferase
MKKYIVVGGVAGGATAAARLRRLDEEAQVLLLERGPYVSFANCGLPYYVGGVIEDRDRLLVQTPEKIRQQLAIDVRVESEVTAVDTKAKKITICSKDRGTYVESYDALLLSPGAQPLRPPIPGIESTRIVGLRNVPDADVLKRLTIDTAARQGSAVVVGGGFIGAEMAENLRERGLRVTVVEAAAQIMMPFDEDMVKFIERELVEHGVEIITGDGVAGFTDTEDSTEVQLVSGRTLKTDFVVLAIGVKPDTSFLQDSGISLDKRGYIYVNEYLQTSVAGVYAVGDAAMVFRVQDKAPMALALAGPANRQGRLAADNMSGRKIPYTGVQGTSILKVFSLTAGATGTNERTLRQQGISCHSVLLHPFSHAGYYPGAAMLTLKVVFGEDGKLFGAQAVGAEGVDKRIDVIASMLRQGASVRELSALELAYAPPFSAAKDPVNMAGYLAENVLDGLTVPVSWAELDEVLAQGTRLIDVRTPLEFANGHLTGAVNLPLEELRERLAELEPRVPLVVYCQAGQRGYYAERLLRQKGFRVRNLAGGYRMAQAQQFVPTVPDGLANQSIFETAAAPAASSGSLPFDEALDLTGLSCPGPLMQLKRRFDVLEPGKVVRAEASDAGFFNDSAAWCHRTGQELLYREKANGLVRVWIKKPVIAANPAEETMKSSRASTVDGKTIVVFSGDLDKALASFVIANGAAAMGKKVTMFFTFWGLNILRRSENIPVEKGIVDRMFGWMMPRGSTNLTLSKMNMLGMGTKLMRRVMQDKNIDSLESLIKSAQQSGIEMVACQMSMDVMGIQPEELIDGVKIGGVGYYLNAAEDSNVNLFI